VGVIVGAVLGAAALLVAIALSVPLLLQKLQGNASYAVGECVVRDGEEAVPSDCSEPDAYEIVVEVGALEECPDFPDQQAITVRETGTVFCLNPVEAATGEESPAGDGTPTGVDIPSKAER
jgi:hypothetical protein